MIVLNTDFNPDYVSTTPTYHAKVPPVAGGVSEFKSLFQYLGQLTTVLVPPDLLLTAYMFMFFGLQVTRSLGSHGVRSYRHRLPSMGTRISYPYCSIY